MSSRRPIIHWMDGAVLMLIFGILYASLARYGNINCSNAPESMLRESLSISGSDALGNVFAYLLLGAALAFAHAQRLALTHDDPRRAQRPNGAARELATAAWAIGACMLLSFSMEAAQTCLSERLSSAWDLFYNTSGAALGWFGAGALLPVWKLIEKRAFMRPQQVKLLAVVLVAALGWLIEDTAPWIPRLDAALMRANLKATWVAFATGHLDAWRLIGHGGEWLALGLALSLPRRDAWLPIMGLSVLAAMAMGWRLMLPGTMPLGPESLLTLPGALLVVLVLLRSSFRTRAALTLIAAIVAVSAYQLKPGFGLMMPFQWRIQLLQGNPIAGMQLAAFFGWFGMTVVAAGKVLSGRTLLWVTAASAITALLEWCQTMIPGRTADLSPTFMTLAGAGLAAGMLSASRIVAAPKDNAAIEDKPAPDISRATRIAS
jgi:VanZ family protein